MLKISITALLGLLASAATSCATTQPSAPPPELPEAGPDGQYQVQAPQPPPVAPRFVHFELGADFSSCNIEAPKFFYDGTEPRPQDEAQLRALVDCLNTEHFEDTYVLLVGKADPRGPNEYNQELAAERAETIKQYLVDAGVAAERIGTQSAGESAAVGDQNQYSYGFDRRVDVVQIGLVVRP